MKEEKLTKMSLYLKLYDRHMLSKQTVLKNIGIDLKKKKRK